MLIIIKEGEVMVLTRQNPKGGPALQGYPIEVDPATGVLGYKVGYCGCGCAEEVLIRTIDVRQVVAKFGWSMEEYESLMGSVKPKEPLRNRMIKFLGGRID